MVVEEERRGGREVDVEWQPGGSYRQGISGTIKAHKSTVLLYLYTIINLGGGNGEKTIIMEPWLGSQPYYCCILCKYLSYGVPVHADL
ncbi:hypothetical protein RHGRI_016734 [Rhododendron griersonianum]|uniref:Uncharacterized protein n=1 Tax=Rhododendron griersonianum TaxID=479676 RepID=A0AAV6JVA7_9ERIC|nr:hypothetical protein RHGRI_016734 [Rhododendron griersonianum]